MNKFEVSNMDLYYGSFHALKNININIPEREITAFIGPSGCGKSTFLKSLNRMNDLVEGCRISGDIKLDGVDIYKDKMDVNVLRKRVGMVFQKPNPFPMSIYDNIAYGPRTHGVRSKARLDEIVEKSLRDAEDFLARQTETLLGEQQIGCLPYRAGLRSERLVRDGAKKGGYYIEAWETLRGIPVVTGVERTFSRQSGRAVQQALSNASWIVLGEYRSDADYIWMATAMWREIGEVQPDVPLCGWAQVERTLTDWIERGRIRDVYSVTLGYAAYAAPDRKYPDDETAYEAEYWLAPTWCVASCPGTWSSSC